MIPLLMFAASIICALFSDGRIESAMAFACGLLMAGSLAMGPGSER